MKSYLIIVAAFIIVSCEEKINRELYNEAWEEQSVEKALLYADQTEIAGEEANALFMAGRILDLRHSYDSSIQYYTKAMRKYEEVGNQDWQAITMKNMGNVHRENSNFLTALDLYQRAISLNISEDIKHKLTLRMAHCNWRIDRWGLAVEQLNKCKDYFKDDSFLLAETNMILGSCTYDYGLSANDSKSFDESFGYFFKAANLYEKGWHKAMAYNNIANTYLQVGKHKEARQYLYKAKALQTNQDQLAIVYHNLGKYHMAMESYDSAIIYLNENIAMTGGTTHESIEGYRRLSDYYIRTGQTEKALQTNDAYFEMNNKVIEERERLKRITKEQEFQLSRTKQIILNQQKEMDHQFWVDFFIVGASIGIPSLVLICLLAWVVQHLRNKMRAINKLISGHINLK